MIWVLTHKHHKTNVPHFNQYWNEAFRFIEIEQGLDVSIIDSVISDSSMDPLVSDSIVKSGQLSKIVALFGSGEVKDGDIIVFTDGWNFTALPLSYLRHEFNLKVKFVAFWADSYFAQSTTGWKRFYKGSKVEHDWHKHFEKALIQTYDFNCYKTGTKLGEFKNRYRNLMNYNHWKRTGLPFEHIYNAGRVADMDQKENIVLFPWPISEYDWSIFLSMKADFPDWTFISVAESMLSREEYLSVLSRAKIVFSSSRLDADMTILFEALSYGCHIMIPDTTHFVKIFGPRYRYPASLLKYRTRLKFIRNRIALQDMFQSIMDNFNLYHDELREDARIIKDDFFQNEPFIEILKQC